MLKFREALKTLFFSALLAIAMLTALQSKLLYHPTTELLASPADAGLAYEEVWLEASDGVKLHGWWIPSRKQRAAAVFFHGNAGNISHRVETYMILEALGLSTLAIDYRGYGRSEGSPSEQGTYDDADAAWAWVQTEGGFADREIVIMGRSLGGGVASALASKVNPAALILESTFTSIPDMAAKVLPFPGVRWLSRMDYNNVERARAIEAPKLHVHSPEDQVVPFEQGRQLFEAAAEPKHFLEIEGTHADGFITTGKPYVNGLRAFLAAVFDNAKD